MKKYLLSFTLVTMAGMVFSLYNNQGNLYSNGGGAPSAGSCAVGGCHGGSPQTSDHIVLEAFKVNGGVPDSVPAAAYEPGQLYYIASGADETFSNTKFGFALSVSAGELNKITGNNATQRANGYMTHTASGTAASVDGGKVWLTSWTAPASGTANFQLYVNATNANNSSTGDVIYSKQLALTQGSSGVGEILHAAEVKVYPNPASDMFNVEFELKKSSKVSISLMGMDGRLIKDIYSNEMKAGKHLLDFNNGLKAGMYLVHINAGGDVITKRMLVQ